MKNPPWLLAAVIVLIAWVMLLAVIIRDTPRDIRPFAAAPFCERE